MTWQSHANSNLQPQSVNMVTRVMAFDLKTGQLWSITNFLGALGSSAHILSFFKVEMLHSLANSCLITANTERFRNHSYVSVHLMNPTNNPTFP